MTPSALRCPRCAGGRLEPAEDALRCAECAYSYPVLSGIACLMPEPGLWRSRLLSDLDEYLSATGRRLHQVSEETRQSSLLPRTHDRLLRTMRALGAERVRVQAFVASLSQGVDRVPPSAIPTRAARTQELTLLRSYENIFRDWAWGDPENAVALGLIARLAIQPLGELAVLGAGAARLSVDVHQNLLPDRTYALDLNALPLLLAHRLLGGAELELYEFPVAPHSDEQVAVLQRLSLPYSVREGLQLLYADALYPPFADATLDSILTPWFIDVVDADLNETAALINRLLKPGGLWMNSGPLRFTGLLSRMLCIEEVRDIVQRSGFELVEDFAENVPYFDSPFSGSRRVETVFCFAARKVGEAEPVSHRGLEPDWVLNPELPIPLLPELVQTRRTSVFTTGVLSMIDGQRSIADVAQALSRSWGLPAATVQDQLRTFLSRLVLS
ncbi:MAG TPA: hypothetical protein VER33_25280 [Polyangiaceae bacterium]|nr:hypothetical protein [Polyangiaceae bacterium]